jgi:FlaA1/EpsC-like NDP-sugar epimerase
MDLATITQWYDLTDRIVVITGGAGVLGGEMACALVETDLPGDRSQG